MICVYPFDCTDFSNNGLGVVLPQSCSVTETLNGEWEVTLVHPIDAEGKWKRLVEGYILRIPVPAAGTPQTSMVDEKYVYKVTAKKLYLYNNLTKKKKKIGTYKKNAEVIVTAKTSDSWYEVATANGTKGYMEAKYLEFVRVDTSSAEDATVIESKQLRDQPFRIYRIVPELTKITVYARHIFYDLLDNMIKSYSGKNLTGNDVAQGISSACLSEHEFMFYSDVTEVMDEFEFTNINPVEALMGDEGVTGVTGCEIARDWFDVYLVNRVGSDTNVQIREGKNLTGITYDVDLTNVATRIMPVGQDEDGDPLYLPELYIDSPNIDSYQSPKWYCLDCSDAKESTSGDDKKSKNQCYTEMREAVQKELDNGCDLPDVTLKVNFVNCADTEEYKDYQMLQNIFLGDAVSVIVKTLGIVVSMRMTEYTYDCLTRQYTEMTLGNSQEALEGNTISSKQIPSGSITGAKLSSNSVGTAQLKAASITARKIAVEAITTELLAAETVTADKLAAGSVTTDKIGANAVTATNIAGKTITADQIAAGSITGDEIASQTITAVNIASKTITADQLKAALITADCGLIDTGAIQTAQIADGSITDAKIVSLNADVITSGTIKAERLLLTGSDGLIYEINATSSGLSKTELAKEDYQKYLNGTVIVAKSLTAAQIAAETITGNEIAANTIKAANIDVASLFANETFTNKLYVSKIYGGTSIEIMAGDIESVESAAQAAKDAAAAAQTTADDATTAASKAQDTATSAASDASKAKTTAENASATAATANANAANAVSAVNASVASVVTEYYDSTSATSLVGGNWTTTAPAWQENHYVWSRSVTTSKDGKTTVYSAEVCITGNTGAQGAQGATGAAGIDYSQGKMLYTDPMFDNGFNSVTVYNNAGDGNVTITRTTKSSDNPFSNATYELTIANTGYVNPSLGGFCFGNTSRANAIFVYRFVAKIPTGHSVYFASNSAGGVYSGSWYTDNAGTGKFQEYIYYIKCGDNGSYSTTGYFYLSGNAGTAASPLKWYLAYATCFDMTNVSDVKTAQAAADAAQATANSAITQIAARGEYLQITDQGTYMRTKVNKNNYMYLYSGGVVLCVSNVQSAVFAPDYVQFRNYRLGITSDGGMSFTFVKNTTT